MSHSASPQLGLQPFISVPGLLTVTLTAEEGASWLLQSFNRLSLQSPVLVLKPEIKGPDLNCLFLCGTISTGDIFLSLEGMEI